MFGFGSITATAQTGKLPEASPSIFPEDLERTDFWAVIDKTVAIQSDHDAQISQIRSALANRTPAQIAAFQRMLDDAMRQSYSWDLWGAAYLANGGASDDGFEYFRYWLISKGRAAFEAVLADPDRLADILSADGETEFESLGYVAREVWAAKTGRDGNEMPIEAAKRNSEPSGRPFSEDPAELAKRYPRLWKIFGG